MRWPCRNAICAQKFWAPNFPSPRSSRPSATAASSTRPANAPPLAAPARQAPPTFSPRLPDTNSKTFAPRRLARSGINFIWWEAAPAAEAALERAWAAGFSALFVTIDTGTAGMRERDIRNGTGQLMGGNWIGMIPHLSQFFSRPAWVAAYLMDGGLHKLPNVVIPGQGPMALIDVAAALADSVVTWQDFHWLREVWPGPIVAKGVLTGDDARRAIDVGAAGVVVSNHGGRQLDGVSATLRVLPEIVKAVNGQIEVLMDGGVRRGGDIIKAICMGARAVLVGRAYAYGLAAAGEPGVTRAIAILRADLERTMKLLGCASISELDQSYVDVPRDWPQTSS